MPLRLRRSNSLVSVNQLIVKNVAMATKDEATKEEKEVCEFTNQKHPIQVLKCFNKLRNRGLFTDVILSTGNREFPCHRAILVAGSKYFEAMFTNDHKESREMVVQISGMQPDVMELLLKYLYSSQVVINCENVQQLLEAANLFQITALSGACTKFLETQLDPCNCIGMKSFAEAHSLTTLFKRASSMIFERFSEVVEHEEFLELSRDHVTRYINNDDINVPREEVVYEAVKRWVMFDLTTRIQDLPDLLTYVRLPLIHPTYFVMNIESDENVVGNPACQPLLQETRKYHILGDEINSVRTQPRRSTGCTSAVVVVGGCDRIGGYNMPYVEAYDPVTHQWSSLAKLPAFTKSEYAVAAYRNSIIVSGGRIHSKDVWLYQSHLDNWVKVASLVRGRWRHRMHSMGGHVYCVGGFDGKSKLKNVERYDNFSNSWQEIAPLLRAVCWPAIASCNGKLFVIGSGTDEDQTVKVQCYDPDAASWTFRGPIPFIPGKFLSAATSEGRIYVIGSVFKSINCFDPSVNEWKEYQVDLDKLGSCGVTACGGLLYITGGKGDGNEASDAVHCFNPRTAKLEKIDKMPRPCCYHGCVAIRRFNTDVSLAASSSSMKVMSLVSMSR